MDALLQTAEEVSNVVMSALSPLPYGHETYAEEARFFLVAAQHDSAVVRHPIVADVEDAYWLRYELRHRI